MTFFNDNGVFNDLRDLFERADLLVESNKGVLSCAFAGVSNICKVAKNESLYQAVVSLNEKVENAIITFRNNSLCYRMEGRVSSNGRR